MILTSLHSQLRWLERVDPTEPYPATTIRKAVEGGDRREIGGRCEVATSEEYGVEIILHRERHHTTVVTVLKEFEEGR